MDQLPRLGKRELICLLLFTCNYVFFVWRGFLFLWVLGMRYVILLWHSLSLPYNYFGVSDQVRHKPDCAAIEDGFGFRKKRDCTICVAKTKALIRCAVTAQLICGFDFTYAKSRFSHNEAQIMYAFMQELIT